MQPISPFARLAGVLSAVKVLSAVSVLSAIALLGAACAPMSLSTPRVTPTVSVAAPQVASGSGALTSPLAQPAAATVLPLPTSPAGTAPQPQTLVGAVWAWVASTFKDGTGLAPSDPARYTFELLNDGNATIQADCNFGAGAWQSSGEQLTFDAIGTTKMACPPDSLDSAFLAQLRNAAAYNLGADGLVIFLKDDAGTMLLSRTVVQATPVALPAEETPTPTEPSAPRPTEISAPQTPIAAETLAPLPTAVVTPTAVVSPTATALPLATALPVATAITSLSGTSWKLTTLVMDGAAVRPSVFRTPLTMVFAADGSAISGVAGCNRYQATFDANATSGALFGPVLTTRLVCARDIMVQEVAFMDALLRAQSYAAEDDALTFFDETANVLLVLTKQ